MENKQKNSAWVSTQIKSFTKWTNNQLQKKQYPAINSIVEDFCDGKTLLNLLDVIYNEPISHNRGNLSDFQKRDNIDKAIKFIENKKIDLVSIDADHIFRKNVKLTLGMTWALILRSISQYGSDDKNTKNIRAVLLKWCRDCTKDYENVNIMDFTSSWNDGLAFNAIMHHFSPHLINYYALSPGNARENLESAFDVAEKHFKIPRLLDPEDLTDNIVSDEKSVITYVSQYYLKLAELEFKSNIETGERHLQKMNEWLAKGVGGYNKLANELLRLLDEKDVLEEQLLVMFATYSQFNTKNNLYEKFLKISSLYGDLRTAHPLMKYAEFETHAQLVPESLLGKIRDSYGAVEKITKKMEGVPNERGHLAFAEQNRIILSRKFDIDSEAERKAFAEKISEKGTNFLSSFTSLLYDEKVKFFDELLKHKRYESYRMETAEKLFRTYDPKNTRFINETNFNNCCFVLNLPNIKVLENDRISFDEYTMFVKEMLIYKNKEAKFTE